jgi:hypothetical protein
MRFNLLLALGFWLSIIYPLHPVSAAPPAEVTENRASIDFPNTVTFQAVIQNSAAITLVELEYGAEQLTCGDVIARARPEITSGKTVQATWTWDMRRSGSLPPGATIWWRWRSVDETGRESVSDRQTITWLDSEHHWQTVTGGDIRLHWYDGDGAFAGDLLDAATDGLALLEQDTGLQPEQPIDLYIYADTYDMREAILYEPGWTGGLAFPEHNIVILGISESDMDWGRDAEVHELTHVLVGHLTFSCLGGVPTWLNEGLAVYSEGELDPASQSQLDDAIRNDELLTIRSLSGGFSEVPNKAFLSYSQSYSIVKYLVEAYGQEKMTSLLTSLRDGLAIDAALQEVYGFDVEGLEDEWRQAIGAAPRAVSPEGQATAQPTPTYVPTIVPIAGGQMAVTPTPHQIPTSSTDGEGGPFQPSSPPLSLTIALLLVCCLLVLVLGVIAIGVFVYAQGHKGGKNG